jgi:hypothetical protein
VAVDATRARHTGHNAGPQKVLFFRVFLLARTVGGEGGTLRHFGTIRLFSWKNQQIRRFRGIHSDYKVDYISQSQSSPRVVAWYVVRTVCLRKTCVCIVVNPANLSVI